MYISRDFDLSKLYWIVVWFWFYDLEDPWWVIFFFFPFSVLQALGDYTRMISDFTVFPYEPKEGRIGSYWYHEDTQAFFDDLDHYKMIRAMCRLSCSMCDKMEGPDGDGMKKRARFRNIEQLKGHLFHQHKLLMCSLCLEGRKVIFCNIWFSFYLFHSFFIRIFWCEREESHLQDACAK